MDRCPSVESVSLLALILAPPARPAGRPAPPAMRAALLGEPPA